MYLSPLANSFIFRQAVSQRNYIQLNFVTRKSLAVTRQICHEDDKSHIQFFVSYCIGHNPKVVLCFFFCRHLPAKLSGFLNLHLESGFPRKERGNNKISFSSSANTQSLRRPCLLRALVQKLLCTKLEVLRLIGSKMRSLI